jgi:hypothetical protein
MNEQIVVLPLHETELQVLTELVEVPGPKPHRFDTLILDEVLSEAHRSVRSVRYGAKDYSAPVWNALLALTTPMATARLIFYSPPVPPGLPLRS